MRRSSFLLDKKIKLLSCLAKKNMEELKVESLEELEKYHPLPPVERSEIESLVGVKGSAWSHLISQVRQTGSPFEVLGTSRTPGSTTKYRLNACGLRILKLNGVKL